MAVAAFWLARGARGFALFARVPPERQMMIGYGGQFALTMFAAMSALSAVEIGPGPKEKDEV